MIFSTDNLELEFNKTTFGVERLAIAGDAEKVSWVRGGNFALPSGNNFLAKSEYRSDLFAGEFFFFSGLTCALDVTKGEDGAAVFRYRFKNDSKKAVETAAGEIGIAFPFNDDFSSSDITLRRRVHAHIRAKGSGYIFCEPYSGAGRSLGLICTQGETIGYSLEREGKLHTRGTPILDLPAFRLAPGEKREWEFTLFPCEGRQDFFSRMAACGLPVAENDGLAVFSGEEIIVHSPNATRLLTEQGEYPFSDGVCRFLPQGVGEKQATLFCGEKPQPLTYFVLPKDIISKRMRFVTEHQYLAEGKYRGAFTAYDPLSHGKVVRGGVHSPFSLGGFSAAPLLFLLKESREKGASQEMKEQIRASLTFYDREIYRGGEVATEVGGRLSRLRKSYEHYPLYATIKYEEYLSFRSLPALEESAAILKNLYASGSDFSFSPLLMVREALIKEKKAELASELSRAVTDRADALIRQGIPFTESRVYDPWKVLASVSALLDAYLLTGKEEYLCPVKDRFVLLEPFIFPSFDYATDRMPELFARDLTSGLVYDASPHFTAVRFAHVFDKYYRATGKAAYGALATRIVKSAMTLFGEEGSSTRGKAAPRALNDSALSPCEQISCGEDLVLYHFGLLFDRK